MEGRQKQNFNSVLQLFGKESFLIIASFCDESRKLYGTRMERVTRKKKSENVMQFIFSTLWVTSTGVPSSLSKTHHCFLKPNIFPSLKEFDQVIYFPFKYFVLPNKFKHPNKFQMKTRQSKGEIVLIAFFEEEGCKENAGLFYCHMAGLAFQFKLTGLLLTFAFQFKLTGLSLI